MHRWTQLSFLIPQVPWTAIVAWPPWWRAPLPRDLTQVVTSPLSPLSPPGPGPRPLTAAWPRVSGTARRTCGGGPASPRCGGEPLNTRGYQCLCSGRLCHVFLITRDTCHELLSLMWRHLTEGWRSVHITLSFGILCPWTEHSLLQFERIYYYEYEYHFFILIPKLDLGILACEEDNSSVHKNHCQKSEC